MSAIKFFTLALASTTVASFHGGHGHRHAARQQPPAYAPPAYGNGAGAAHPTGTGSPYPYPIANATGVWGSTGISKPSAPAGYGSSSAAGPQTNTEYSTLYSTHYKTLTVDNQQAPSSTPAPSGNDVSPAGYGSGSGSDSGASQSGGSEVSPTGGAGGEDDEQCKPVTVTYTEKVTMTLTEGQTAPASTNASPAETGSAPAPPAYSAPPSSSESSPAQSSAPAAPPADSAPGSSSSEASPAQSSASSSPVYPVAPSSNEGSPAKSSAPSAPAYPVASSNEASPATTSTAPALSAYGDVKQVAPKSSASSTSSAASPSSTGTSSGSGKRGLAYNDASLTKCFEGSREISWAYNWGSSSDGLSSNFMFVPTLWGDGSEFTSKWSDNAQAAIDSGSTHLFSFNEPDHAEQANMACGTAATAYAEYMNPFKGKAQLCAPSVTNGGGQMGLTWLEDFLSQCTDCQIDCLNIHWYDSASNVEYFKQHIQDAAALAPGKPIYVSEFGATGSDDEISQFLQEVMPWMDSNSDVAGYAYFMASDSKLVTGTEPSTYGKTYMSYYG